MVRYFCQACGFVSRELYVGPGEDATFVPVLVTCTSCKTLRSVHRPDVAAGCRKHRKAFVQLAEDGPVGCPRCGAPMGSMDTGLWD